MDYRGEEYGVTIARVNCNRCGYRNLYDVMRLNLSSNSNGFVKTTCSHCGARFVTNIDAFDYATAIIKDKEIEIV